MDYRTFDADICIMTKVTNLIGGKWKPIILYLIQNDVNRFGAMIKSMPKISKKVLTEQLRELEGDKIVAREVVKASAPQLVVYSLTEMGISLRTLIDQMIEWGMQYYVEDYTEEMLEQHIQKKFVSDRTRA